MSMKEGGTDGMGIAMIVIALFLTGYTLLQAWRTWRKENNAAAGAVIALLSGCFLPLALYLIYRD